MRRTNIAIAAFAVVILCAFTLTGHAQSPKMVINQVKAFPAGLQRGPVTFMHDQHTEKYKLECTSCHHKYDAKQPGKNLWEMGDETSCAACHAGAKPTAKLNLQDAYHKGCISCHSAPKGKLANGPRSCAGCHEVK